MKMIPIDVESETRQDGVLIPKVIHWRDGRKFNISRVVFFGDSPVCEYKGIRYTVIIGRSEKYIYRIDRKWYLMQ